MIWGALFLICAAGRELTSESISRSKQWNAYINFAANLSLHQSSGRTLNFRTESAEARGNMDTAKISTARTNAARKPVQSSPSVEIKSQISRREDKTESNFTRHASSSRINRIYHQPIKTTYFGSCEDSECKTNLSELSILEAKKCVDHLSPKCLLEEVYDIRTNPIKPNGGIGCEVQSFSGLDTSNFNYILLAPTIVTELKVPGESELTIHLKEDSRSDCFLFLSAYSPLNKKILPIGYIEFKQSKNESIYTLNEQLIASLYNMGKFDLQFKNNHLTNPCEENDNIASIEAASKFHIIRGGKLPAILELNEIELCPVVDSTNLLIDMKNIKDEIANLLQWFPETDLEVPLKLRLELENKYSVGQIDNWQVSKTYKTLACSMHEEENNRKDVPTNQSAEVWSPIEDRIFSNTVYTAKESGSVVEVDFRVSMRYKTKIPTFIRILILDIEHKNIKSSTLSFGDLPDKDKVEKVLPTGEMTVYRQSRLGNRKGFVPLMLAKPKITATRDRNVDDSYDCSEKTSTVSTVTTVIKPTTELLTTATPGRSGIDGTSDAATTAVSPTTTVIEPKTTTVTTISTTTTTVMKPTNKLQTTATPAISEVVPSHGTSDAKTKSTTVGRNKELEGGLSNTSVTNLACLFCSIAIFLCNTQ